VLWLPLMLAYSPVADRIASRWFATPPTLGTFRALQQSRVKLVLGIVVAWVLGGFLEEVLLRGIVLQPVEWLVAQRLPAVIAAGTGICVAATVAFVLHLYQGRRAAFIVAQLSVLLGLLFVASGHNLWTVILCHGLYDTVAFIRFGLKKSKYARLRN
jgi:membrane protease YdiL (CAAX protease family)